MHRLTRTLALLVLLTSVIQIGGCVTGCDCFALPAGPTALAHTGASDTDGCLCCGQYLGFRIPATARVASIGEFLPPLPPAAVACDAQTGIDHPPRS
jgi:hypothetical protein